MSKNTRTADYAYRYWKRSGLTEWPTVRQAARATGISQREIEERSGVDYDLTGFEEDPLGDQHVEAQTDEAEAAWCEYWLPLTKQCVCGTHRSLR